jgi:hypothetical protein
MSLFDEYIKEWISVENIVADKVYNQKFLENLAPGTTDICYDVPIEQCDTNKCDIYHSTTLGVLDKCVTRTRIKQFISGTEENPTIITGKNKQKYEIIHSDEAILTTSRFVKNRFIDVDISMYYYILMSHSTKNIYIIFSTGSILSSSELEDEFLLGFLRNIISGIDFLHKNNLITNKLILCGHSMGCVLALSIAKILHQEDVFFFADKIIVVGSSPTKFLTTQEVSTFHSLSNVKIFVYCDKKERNRILLDCFIIKGSKDLVNYKPFTVIGPGESEFDLSEGNEYNIDYIEDQVTCIAKHKWSNYYKVLCSLYPLLNNDIVGGSKRRKTRRRKNVKKIRRKSRETRISIHKK